MEKIPKGLYLFTRDLRLEDNPALNEALRRCHEVIPLFILDPRQTDENRYFSPRAFSFMLESLEDLSQSLARQGGKLTVIRGRSEEVLARLLSVYEIRALFCQKDYTPFAREREKRLESLCAEHGAEFNSLHQSLLFPPGSILTGSGEPYRVFTPFKKKAFQLGVPAPEKIHEGIFSSDEFSGRFFLSRLNGLKSSNLNEGGRKRGLERFKAFLARDDYKAYRDLPAQDATSRLAAHLKFGTLSVREVWHEARHGLSEADPYLWELLWRDFFTQVAYYYPHVFQKSFQSRYDTLFWDEPREKFQKWCRGETGFPLVDAGMRQLNETGFMHNRTRMVAASFLIKDLHIHWREGERYFAAQLTDYDPCVNNGNWQWAASTGCDAVPYFRIMNPWFQQKRFDPRGDYIKKWIPELDGLEVHVLHNPHQPKKGYPRPIVDHTKERLETLNRYRSSPMI
jgi:deoxyribodipyrimidine photo-lyase